MAVDISGLEAPLLIAATNIVSNSDIPNIDTIIELDGLLMCEGHHVLPLSMDTYTSCLHGLVRDEEGKYRGTERLPAMAGVCMGYLTIPNTSFNVIQSMIPLHLLEKF